MAAGAGLGAFGDMLQMFLMDRLGLQKEQRDRDERQKDRDLTKQYQDATLGLEKRRVDSADRAQRTSEAGVLRSNLQPGAVDDPELIARIRSAFKDTPFEATFQDKQTLPSTGFGDAAGQGSQGGTPFGFLQPTSQEQRDQLLMKMEQQKADTEAREAPLRQQVLQNQGVTSSPAYLEKRLKEQHQFDLEDIRARVSAMYSTSKKTSLDDDFKAYFGALKAMDGMTDPNDVAVAQAAISAFGQALKTKYPTMFPAKGPEGDGGPDVNNLPDVPTKPSGPGMISRFLSGLKLPSTYPYGR